MARKRPRRLAPAVTICRGGVRTAPARWVEISPPVAVDLAWKRRLCHKVRESSTILSIPLAHAGGDCRPDLDGERTVADGEEDEGDDGGVPGQKREEVEHQQREMKPRDKK